MLSLSLKPGKAVLIGGNIRIVVQRQHGSYIRLGVEAPRDVRVLRESLLTKDKEKAAVTIQPAAGVVEAAAPAPLPATVPTPTTRPAATPLPKPQPRPAARPIPPLHRLPHRRSYPQLDALSSIFETPFASPREQRMEKERRNERRERNLADKPAGV